MFCAVGVREYQTLCIKSKPYVFEFSNGWCRSGPDVGPPLFLKVLQPDHTGGHDFGFRKELEGHVHPFRIIFVDVNGYFMALFVGVCRDGGGQEGGRQNKHRQNK